MPSMVWTAPFVDAPTEPFTGDERAMLEGFLDNQRAMLLYSCAGLTAEQLAHRSVPPSTLSLAGLVRHLADVERTFFRRRWGSQNIAPLHGEAGDTSHAFDGATADTAPQDLDRLTAEQQAAREAAARAPLDQVFVHHQFGEMSLRWAYLHMIREYAEHNGHAALLRECIDGRTGG